MRVSSNSGSFIRIGSLHDCQDFAQAVRQPTNTVRASRHLDTQSHTDDTPQTPLAPKQQRSREKYERMIAAAYSLAAEAGFEGVTLSKIAKRAGVAPSTVYTRFADKDALLHALHEITTARSRAEIVENFEGLAEQKKPLKDILRDIIYRSLELTDEIAGFQKACYQRALSDSTFAKREALVREQLTRSVRRLFRARKAEIGRKDISVSADFFVAMYTSVITEHVMSREFPVESLSNNQIRRELLSACLMYLKIT